MGRIQTHLAQANSITMGNEEIVRVQDLIEELQMMPDPKAPVTHWIDGNLYEISTVSVINADQAQSERRHRNTVTLS
jgi:hypothetical protein